jgi:hypothetical protein
MKSKSKAPSIPMNEVMSWEDWLKGRRWRRELGNRVAPEVIRRSRRWRRELGNRVAPEVIRRSSSSSDPRLRRLYKGERGLPFTPTDKL